MKKLFITLLIVVSIAPLANAGFSDILAVGDMKYDAILWMEENGIVEGYSGGNFRPDDPVNRVEFLKMLYGTLGVDEADFDYTEEVDSSVFSDLPLYDVWYTPFLSQAVHDGIVDGNPDGTFRPDDSINVAEASKIIGNAFLNIGELYTSDWDPGNSHCVLNETFYEGEWFWGYIAVLDNSCLYPASVISNDGYHPGADLTRGEMAFMLYGARSVVEESGEVGSLDDYEVFDGFDDPPSNVIADNEFVARFVDDGYVVGDWTLIDVGPGQKDFAFDGDVEISGEYYWDLPNTCIIPDVESASKMPILVGDEYGPLCFSDHHGFKDTLVDLDELFAAEATGTLTVVVNYFNYHYGGENIISQLNLYEVINITQN